MGLRRNPAVTHRSKQGTQRGRKGTQAAHPKIAVLPGCRAQSLKSRSRCDLLFEFLASCKSIATELSRRSQRTQRIRSGLRRAEGFKEVNWNERAHASGAALSPSSFPRSSLKKLVTQPPVDFPLLLKRERGLNRRKLRKERRRRRKR